MRLRLRLLVAFVHFSTVIRVAQLRSSCLIHPLGFIYIALTFDGFLEALRPRSACGL